VTNSHHSSRLLSGQSVPIGCGGNESGDLIKTQQLFNLGLISRQNPQTLRPGTRHRIEICDIMRLLYSTMRPPLRALPAKHTPKRYTQPDYKPEFQLEKTLIQKELPETGIFRLAATLGSQSTVARNGGHRIGGNVMRGSISINPGSQLGFQFSSINIECNGFGVSPNRFCANGSSRRYFMVKCSTVN